MNWACGVTTIPERWASGLLHNTLRSLTAGGFDRPQVFVDGLIESRSFIAFSLLKDTSFHNPKVGAFGNWALGLWELYLRNPKADRYAMFQDDLVCYRRLREYLDVCAYPERGYWNLLTFRDNERLVAEGTGWHESVDMPNAEGQTGRGAVALVFDRQAVTALLGQPSIVAHAQLSRRGIDGAVVEAMNAAGYREYVHSPSLVQHVGEQSTLSSKVHTARAGSFRGQEYDAMELLVYSSQADPRQTP